MTVQEKANQSRKIMREYKKGLLTEGEMLRSVMNVAETTLQLVDVLIAIEDHEASVEMPDNRIDYELAMQVINGDI